MEGFAYRRQRNPDLACVANPEAGTTGTPDARKLPPAVNPKRHGAPIISTLPVAGQEILRHARLVRAVPRGIVAETARHRTAETQNRARRRGPHTRRTGKLYPWQDRA